MKINKKLLLYILTILIATILTNIASVFYALNGPYNIKRILASMYYLNPFQIDFWLNMATIIIFPLPLFLVFYRKRRSLIVKYIIPITICCVEMIMSVKIFAVAWNPVHLSPLQTLIICAFASFIYSALYFTYMFLDKLWNKNEIGSE